MELGIIEGFYGRCWSWPQREAVVTRLAPRGYGFYHYAPKADPGVKGQWREPWPEAQAARMRGFAADCRRAGLRFGVGISPQGLQTRFDAAGRAALGARLAQLDAIGVDDLVILFDDLRGDTPDLARVQCRILEWAAARTAASRVFLCPTYYSNDPLLDELFGPRPPGYLAALGHALDPAVRIYWAGEAICPQAIRPTQVARVAETLRRRPVLWDNYPVNDSPRMARHLHLRAFSGRPAGLRAHAAAHAVNPALQPILSTLPACTLPESYRLGARYDSAAAFRRAARAMLGAPLAAMIEADLPTLQDVGLDADAATLARLRARYRGQAHPAAQEIVAWLDGRYRAGEDAAPTG